MDRDTAREILRIGRDASHRDIEAAFKRMVKRYPPEFKPEKFAQVKLAYEVLTTAGPIIEKIKRNPKEALFEILEVRNPLDTMTDISEVPSTPLRPDDFSELIELHRKTWLLPVLRTLKRDYDLFDD